jgi:hypothetical protein
MMQRDQLADSEVRGLVIGVLDREPDATFPRVLAHLRAREGRSLDDAETEHLREAYDAELANPTGAHRIGASEAAQIAAHQPFALRKTEIAGLVVGLIPLIIHLPTTTPSTVARGTGQTVAGSSYDFVAMLGGFVAIALGLIAFRLALHDLSQRTAHFALAAVIVLLGVYQSLFGLGILHQLGLFRAG